MLGVAGRLARMTDMPPALSARSRHRMAYAVPAEGPRWREGELIPVDAQLVADETPYEILDGRLHKVSGAKPPHAIRHAQVGAVLHAHAASGYVTATDLLARVAQDSDVAPDTSIFPEGLDPVTSGRRLEELVVEVSGRQSFALLTRKAERLGERGVRRIFCVRVRKRVVLEWDHAAKAWSELPLDGSITDACLVRPLAVQALFDAARGDDETARALLVKGNPVLRAALATARSEGEVAGRRHAQAEAVLAVLAARGLHVPDEVRDAIVGCADDTKLARWLKRAVTVNDALDVVRPPRAKSRS